MALKGKIQGQGIREVSSEVRAARRSYAAGGSSVLDTLAAGMVDRSLKSSDIKATMKVTEYAAADGSISPDEAKALTNAKSQYSKPKK